MSELKQLQKSSYNFAGVVLKVIIQPTSWLHVVVEYQRSYKFNH